MKGRNRKRSYYRRGCCSLRMASSQCRRVASARSAFYYALSDTMANSCCTSAMHDCLHALYALGLHYREFTVTSSAADRRHPFCPSACHLGTIAQLCRAIRNKECIDNRKKLNINISSTCPENMVNFGPLAAEIGLPVWGTPANFNGVLAALGLLRSDVAHWRPTKLCTMSGLNLRW